MSAFVAKIQSKNVYQNYRFLKQRTNLNDNQLFAFMVNELAKTVNNAVEQAKQEKEQANDHD